MRRLTPLGAVVAGLVVAGAPLVARADYVRPLPDPERPGVAVGVWAATGQDDSSGGLVCSSIRFDETTDADIVQPFLDQHPGERGGVYLYNCRTSHNRSLGPGQLAWFPEPAPDPLTLAQEAVRRLQLPEPLVGVNPPADRPQVVNLPTWLWVERSWWIPQQATAWVPGVSATVVATPVRVTWDMGDGHRVGCDGPGQPYTPGHARAGPVCGHTYRHSSAGRPDGVFPVTATVIWQVTWSAAGVPGGGTLPPVTSGAQLALRVGEIQALN